MYTLDIQMLVTDKYANLTNPDGSRSDRGQIIHKPNIEPDYGEYLIHHFTNWQSISDSPFKV